MTVPTGKAIVPLAGIVIVSPALLMLSIQVVQSILKDARMREQAGAIRMTLRQLHRDVELVAERVEKLSTHFNQARSDLDAFLWDLKQLGWL